VKASRRHARGGAHARDQQRQRSPALLPASDPNWTFGTPDTNTGSIAIPAANGVTFTYG
jgi:hypothetical protein